MATIWSVILNRIDSIGQTVWKEWRGKVVTSSSGSSDAGAIPMLGEDGKLDSSMVSGGTGGGHTIQVNGAPLPQETILNFVGSTVTGTDIPATSTTQVYISGSGGGGGSSANTVTTTVDFGFSGGDEGDIARTTVYVPWVTSSSVILCSSAAVATSDHDPEDAALENIQVWAENIVPGTSFDIIAIAPQNSWGQYQIQAVGF